MNDEWLITRLDSTYQQHLVLQDPNTDPIIGIRYDTTKLSFPEYEKRIDFYVMLNVSGLLKLTVDVEATRNLVCDYQNNVITLSLYILNIEKNQEYQSLDFYSRLEQTVLYSHQQVLYNETIKQFNN